MDTVQLIIVCITIFLVALIIGANFGTRNR